MSVIREEDVIASVADALQYISYYHTPDFIRAMGRAYAVEQSPAARDAIAQILTNSRTLRRGPSARYARTRASWSCSSRWAWACAGNRSRDLDAMINEGVRRAYLHPDNKLRASIVADPACKRTGTRDNTPAVIHTEFVPGDQRRDHRRRQGRRIREQIHVRHAESLRFGRRLGGREWCPRWARAGARPGMLGVGIGGSAEKAMLLGEEIAHGADRHRRSHRRAGRAARARGIAPGNLPARQRLGDRRAGSRRSHHRARREGSRTIRRMRRPSRWR